MAILAALSLGNLYIPAEIQGKAIVLILFLCYASYFIAIFQQRSSLPSKITFYPTIIIG